jgi:hypothetical protein
MTTDTVRPTDRADVRADVLAGTAAVVLFAAAAVVGAVLGLIGHPVHAGAAPIFGHLLPHVGPGTPVALLTAAFVVLHGPRLAGQLPWGRLLGVSYAVALLWTFALALVDGWQRGLAGRLTTKHEYLTEVHRTTVRGFTDHILDGQTDSWTTHVAGHPPGALLVFTWLDRIGLGGGGWAAVVCVLVGATVAVSVPVTVKALAGVDAARAVVPFVVLFPGAVWVGASADGLFMGVTAAGIALLAAGRHRTAVAAGVLLGFACFLSYGLLLMAPIALAVLTCVKRWSLVPAALAGAAAVTAAFAAAGFWWLDGYHLVVERYYQGIASDRPFAYWAWANVACVVAAAGPVAVAVLRRAIGDLVSGASRWLLMPISAAVAIALADISGLSKAEVERIWLPFTIWLLAATALLPARSRRGWLVAQAATALAINHLVLTAW